VWGFGVQTGVLDRDHAAHGGQGACVTAMPAPDVFYAHGLGKTLKAPDWPAITAPELEAVAAGFPGAGRVRDIVWRSPRPFSAGACFTTVRGAFFLKRHPLRLRSMEDLREEHRLGAYLRAQGVPVASVVPTHDGDTVLRAGPWTYELHHVGAGEDVYRDRLSWTPFLCPAHARTAGAALARLHGALAAYHAPPRQTTLLVANDHLMRSADPVATLAQDLGRRPALARFLRGRAWQADMAAHLLPFHAEARAAFAAAPPLWGHGDWHGSNLLWSADGPSATVTTILDFGLSDRTSAVFDLATAIERSVISWLDLDGGEATADLDQLDAVLAGYGDVVPLSGAFLSALAAILPVVHVGFALSEVEYFTALLDDSAQAELAYGPYCLGHADWFTRPEGARLIRHLRGLARTAP